MRLKAGKALQLFGICTKQAVASWNVDKSNCNIIPRQKIERSAKLMLANW